jgi:hypothetical protein
MPLTMPRKAAASRIAGCDPNASAVAPAALRIVTARSVRRGFQRAPPSMTAVVAAAAPANPTPTIVPNIRGPNPSPGRYTPNRTPIIPVAVDRMNTAAYKRWRSFTCR